VKKGHYAVEDLYDPAGIYWYKYGINWRAYAAYIGGIIPNLPGFVGAMGHPSPPGADKIFNLAWPIGFALGALIYLACNFFFPCTWIIAEREKEIVMDPSAYDKEKTEQLPPSTSSVSSPNRRQARSIYSENGSIV
jgi:NCS1 family nucleobase:cation symporter-1